MNASETRTTASLALLFAIRMLGLFILLPVLSVLGRDLQGATPALLGLAIGIYGLTQAALQILFGALSDRYGRKPFILAGMVLFIIGSLVAAFSDSVHGVIIGRALQGSGAIGGVITALLADITRPEVRTKAMAMIGASIGGAFLLALIIGPILGSALGLSGLFYAIAALGVAGLVLASYVLPGHYLPRTAVQKSEEGKSVWSYQGRSIKESFLSSLQHPHLFRLFFGVLILHMLQTTLFVALPQVLVTTHQFAIEHHWQLYLPVMLLSFVFIIPIIIAGEKKGSVRILMLCMILAMLAGSLILLAQFNAFIWLAAGLFLFFSGFNALEALMPAVVSRIAAAGERGICMSTYATFQFFGAFLGGSLGGLIFGAYDFAGVVILNIVMLGIWILFTLGLSAPADVKALTISTENMDPNTDKLYIILLGLPGVREVYIDTKKSVAHLKVDKRVFDNSFLEDLRLFHLQSNNTISR